VRPLVHVRAARGYVGGMTTTPEEPLPEPEIVPSGDPVPTDPDGDPAVTPEPEVDPGLPG